MRHCFEFRYRVGGCFGLADRFICFNGITDGGKSGEGVGEWKNKGGFGGEQRTTGSAGGTYGRKGQTLYDVHIAAREQAEHKEQYIRLETRTSIPKV
jgi:hypothetical protein